MIQNTTCMSNHISNVYLMNTGLQNLPQNLRHTL